MYQHVVWILQVHIWFNKLFCDLKIYVRSRNRIYENKQARMLAELQVYKRARFLNIHKSAIKGTNSLCLLQFISSPCLHVYFGQFLIQQHIHTLACLKPSQPLSISNAAHILQQCLTNIFTFPQNSLGLKRMMEAWGKIESHRQWNIQLVLNVRISELSNFQMKGCTIP
jgi:hypothetical protein